MSHWSSNPSGISLAVHTKAVLSSEAGACYPRRSFFNFEPPRIAMTLEDYKKKRHFGISPEPSGKTSREKNQHPNLLYVAQKHRATQLHYDFRLELNGTLLSWAVPKGPSLDPSVKRLAGHVDNHPGEYGSCEGEIPPGNYGAGPVSVGDRGRWEAVGGAGEAEGSYKAGKLKFRLFGEK